MLHSKSPKELKAHTIFVIELMVVIGALLTGAAIELWGVFPQDYVDDLKHWTRCDVDDNNGQPFIPNAYATFFTCMNCLSLVLQLFNTVTWATILYIGAAVSPSQFPKYFYQTMHTHK